MGATCLGRTARGEAGDRCTLVLSEGPSGSVKCVVLVVATALLILIGFRRLLKLGLGFPMAALPTIRRPPLCRGFPEGRGRAAVWRVDVKWCADGGRARLVRGLWLLACVGDLLLTHRVVLVRLEERLATGVFASQIKLTRASPTKLGSFLAISSSR